ncbi:MAG: QueT transporter family protein [Lachnospiraceae bacterium]|nr:QueT transporter family protein [Lachnospiraceae bacterium]
MGLTGDKRIIYITQSAMIAAIYVVFTVFVASFNLASGAIQIRISEAMTVLPAFTNAAVPGLFAGCLLANLITGCAPMDVIFGSIATLIGALGTYALRKKHRFLASVPPIIANTLIVPFVLRYVYNIPGSIPFFMLTVGAGEVISCGILGQILYHALVPLRNKIFDIKE